MNDAKSAATDGAELAAISRTRRQSSTALGRGPAQVGPNHEPHLTCASCTAPATHAVTRRDGSELTTSCDGHVEVWVGRLSA